MRGKTSKKKHLNLMKNDGGLRVSYLLQGSCRAKFTSSGGMGAGTRGAEQLCWAAQMPRHGVIREAGRFQGCNLESSPLQSSALQVGTTRLRPAHAPPAKGTRSFREICFRKERVFESPRHRLARPQVSRELPCAGGGGGGGGPAPAPALPLPRRPPEEAAGHLLPDLRPQGVHVGGGELQAGGKQEASSAGSSASSSASSTTSSSASSSRSSAATLV